MKRFGAALLLLMGLLFGCTVLTGLDHEYVLDTASSSGSTGGSVDSSCEPGTKRDCYPGPEGTQDVGLCKTGEQVCDELGTAYGPCVGAVLPSTEVCAQAEDANCDGELTCSGKAIWSHLFGSVEDQMGVSVAIDSGGNTLLAGHFTGSIQFGPEAPRRVSAGGYDVFVAKLDPGGNHVWSYSFGGVANERCYGVEVDSTDNVVLTGDFESTIDFGGEPLPYAGGHDVFVAKLDPTGTHVWSKRAGDAASQYGYGIAVNRADNSVVVTGTFESTMSFEGASLTSAGEPEMFVVKFNSSGTQMWIKQFGDNMARGSSVAVNGAGDIALTGAFQGVINFGGGPLTSAGDEDIFVAKLSASGSFQWSKQFGDAASQVRNDVAFDSGGNVVLAGSFAGTVNFGGASLTSAGDLDVFVAKLTANGGHVWSNQFGGAESQLGNGLAIDFADDVVLTGSFAGSFGFGGAPLVSAGDLDVFVAKLAANGGHVWSKGFGSPLDQKGQGVAVNKTGVVLTGDYKGSVKLGGGWSPPAGGIDMFTAKLDVNGEHGWSKFYGDTRDHIGTSIAVDGAGDVVLTGYLEESIDLGDGRLPGAGGFDAFVAKLSSDGKHLWGKRFGNAGTQFIVGVAIDSAGNIVLVGYFDGVIDFGNETRKTNGGFDLFVAKFSHDGTLLWSKSFGDDKNQSGYGLAIDDNDNILLTGIYEGTLDFGGGGLPSKGGQDVFVAKLSPEGDYIWSKFYGEKGNDVSYAIATDSAGDIVLVGYFLSSTLVLGGGPLLGAGGWDVFVAKYSANGDHLWSERFGGPNDDRGLGVAINEMDEIVLTGDYTDAVDFGGEPLTNAGGTDVFITKLSADGSYLWSKRFGNALAQVGKSVAIDSAGNIVLTGDTTGGFEAGGVVFASGGGTDVFAVKLAANGDHIWSKGFGDIATQLGRGVAIDSAGNALLTGAAGGRIDFGGGTLPLISTGAADVFVAKLAP